MGISAAEFYKWVKVFQISTGGSPPPTGALLGVNNLSDVQDRATSVANLQLTPGVYTQSQNSQLQSLSDLSLQTNAIPYWTGPSGFGNLPTSSDARALLSKTYVAMVIALGVLPLTGGAMSGGILLPLEEPSQDQSAVTKIYVDNAISSIGSGFLRTTLNLQDLGNVSQARVNLGLGDLATQNTLSFNGAVGGAGGVGGITLTLNPSVVQSSNLENYAVTLSKIQLLNPKTLIGNSDNAVTGSEEIPFSTFAQTSLALSDIDPVSARFNLGLKQAALKDVTDNTKQKVSSVVGSFQIGNVLVSADSEGSVKDGGALGLLAYESTVTLQGAVLGSGVSTITTTIPNSSIDLIKLSSIPANSLLANPTDSATNPTTIPISTFVQKSGDTMFGELILSGNPIQSLGAATKQYVDSNLLGLASISGASFSGSVYLNGDQTLSQNSAATKGYVDSIASGANIHAPVKYATTFNYSVVYNNGVNGVGATLTNAGAKVPLVTDGQPPEIGARVLFKNQISAPYQNGIYDVINPGAVGVDWVVRRSSDYDTVPEVASGDTVVVTDGDTQATSTWVQYSQVSTIGTDPIEFVKTSISPGQLGTAAFKNATNNINPSVASIFGAPVVGNFATFQDAAGSIGNGGTPGQFAYQNSIAFGGPGDISGGGAAGTTISLTINPSAVSTGKIQNNAVTLAKLQQLNAESLIGNATIFTGSSSQIPFSTFARPSLNLSEYTPTADLARASLGLGTASIKNASDNTTSNILASVFSPITAGNFAVFADNVGTIWDGGTPGLFAFQNSISFDSTEISGSGAANTSISLSLKPSSINLSKLQTISPNTLLGNLTASIGNVSTVSSNIFVQRVNYVIFNSSGTYTKPANLIAVQFIAVGSGGSGPGSPATTVTQSAAGSGGGGGNTTMGIFPASSVPSTVSITIGASAPGGAIGANGIDGSPTIIGSLVTANGGLRGLAGTASNQFQIVNPSGVAPLGTTGQVFIYGSPGGPGFAFGNSSNAIGGNGGTTTMGGETLGGIRAPGNTGIPNTGEGGSGASTAGTLAGQPGGASASGKAIAIEFLGGI